jgi:hypothetical protein
MKTKIKGLLAILLGLFMFSSVFSSVPNSVETKAPQCPKIENRTHCDVKLVVTFYKRDPQTGMCTTNPCSAPISIVIPPGGSVPATPPAGCDCSCISITVVSIGGMSIVPPVTVNNFGNGFQPLPANPCGATGVMYDATIPAFIIF